LNTALLGTKSTKTEETPVILWSNYLTMQRLFFLFLSLTVSVSAEGEDVCTPCWDGSDPDEIAGGDEVYVCQEGIDAANTTTIGMGFLDQNVICFPPSFY
jgi:hypothetical protein